jgi:hypothetical protein
MSHTIVEVKNDSAMGMVEDRIRSIINVYCHCLFDKGKGNMDDELLIAGSSKYSKYNSCLDDAYILIPGNSILEYE